MYTEGAALQGQFGLMATRGIRGTTRVKLTGPVRITHAELHDLSHNIVPLEEHHCAAMLSVILTWGSLDGLVGMFLSRIKGLPYTVGADEFSELSTSARFNEIRNMLAAPQTPVAAEAARQWRRRKKIYEKCSRVRNLIAHSHCAGV